MIHFPPSEKATTHTQKAASDSFRPAAFLCPPGVTLPSIPAWSPHNLPVLPGKKLSCSSNEAYPAPFSNDAEPPLWPAFHHKLLLWQKELPKFSNKSMFQESLKNPHRHSSASISAPLCCREPVMAVSFSCTAQTTLRPGCSTPASSSTLFL